MHISAYMAGSPKTTTMNASFKKAFIMKPPSGVRIFAIFMKPI